MLEIIINGNSLEVPKESIKYNIQCNDIGDLESRQCNYTDGFSIPKTLENTRYFEHLGLVGDVSTLPYQKVNADLIDNGVHLIRGGWLEIQETAKEYKLNIRDGIIDFFKAIGNKTFGDDIDLSEINHNKNLNTIVNSFTNPNYRYIINDYGGKTHTDNGTKINIDFLVPSVSYPYLWNKIFTTFGFEYDGDIFDSKDFKDLWLTYPKGLSIENQTAVEYANLTRTNDQNFSLTALLSWENSTVNSGNLIFDWRYQVPETGNYRLEFLINYTPTFFDANPLFQIRINNQSIGFFARNIINTVNLQLTENSIIEVFFPRSLILFQQSYLKVYKYNDIFDFSDELKQLSITDFFKETLWRFSLTVFVDIDGKLIFKTFDDRLQADVTDWSKKYVRRTSETYIPKSYAQLNRFEEKYKKENLNYNDGLIDLNNENLDDEFSVIKSKFYTYDKDITPFYINGNRTEPVFRTELWDRDLNENNQTPKIDYKSLSGRFHLLRCETINESAILKSETLSSEQAVTSLPIARFIMTSFKDFVAKYYNNYKLLLQDFRMHKINLNINSVDINQIEMDKVYYFEQEQNYYILNKLTYQVGKNANADFYRIKYTEANYCQYFKANDDVAFVNDGETITINVLENDNYPLGLLSVVIITQPVNGTAVVNADNTITYTHNTGMDLTDSITYSLQNGLCSSTAVVQIKEFQRCIKLVKIEAEDNFEIEIRYQYIECESGYLVQDSFIATTGEINVCIKEGSLFILGTESVTVTTGLC